MKHKHLQMKHDVGKTETNNSLSKGGFGIFIK